VIESLGEKSLTWILLVRKIFLPEEVNMDLDKATVNLSEILADYVDGEPGKNPVSGSTRPLADMQGFESDFIPEVVRRLAREVFGEPLPKGTRVKNIFVEKGRKLTVKEIAKKFLSNYAPKGVKV
jgi:hypothetical protein